MKLIGVGGEAMVYDLGRGRALKLFKDSRHPDVAGDPALMAAADARLDEHQQKLPAMLKRTWPVEVVAPLELHEKNGRIVGYVMPLIAPADGLFDKRADKDMFRLLRALHAALSHVHRAGAIVGDLNPFNVLVSGDRVRLIDADSYQFERFRCFLFTERYTDPRLMAGLHLAHEYDADADWYAFSALVLECLTGVYPYGGVHPRLLPSERLLRGVTIFDADVKLPRAARPFSALPKRLVDYLRQVFVDGERGVFPDALLETLALAPLPVAKIVHAAGLNVMPVTFVAPQQARVWMQGDAIHAAGPLGPVHLGDALEGATQLWVGPRFGLGFYRAGEKPVAFMFALDRRALNDSLVLPRLPAILSVHALVSERMATLVVHVRDGAKLRHHAICFDTSGQRLAELDDAPAELLRAAAMADALLVPTDAGVVRMQPLGGQLVVTARFPLTQDIVTSASQLHVGNGGLIVQTAHETVLVRMQGASS